MLCPPPMDMHGTMIASVACQSANHVPNHGSLLGFRRVLAPLNKLAGLQNKGFNDNPAGRGVSKPPRDLHDEAKTAPHLHIVVQELLEARSFQKGQIKHI